MDKEQIAQFLGTPELSVAAAMERIDCNAKGILFLVDDRKRLMGSVTDGDIRRWLLKTGNLTAPVKDAMKKAPKFLFVKERGRVQDILKQESITALPLLNSDCTVADIILADQAVKDVGLARTGELSGVPLVIMAGGRGTRLYPYTRILPKPLIPVAGTPIIERIIDAFAAYGLQRVYITVNYKKNMIKSYFTELDPGYEIRYVEEDRPLGTGGSLKLIRERFDRPVIVSNCDSLVKADYAELYECHRRSGNQVTVVSALKNVVVPYGVLKLGENGEIIGMEEKPVHPYFINTGLYVLEPEVIDRIPDGIMFHMPHLMEAIMKDGGRVGMYPVSEDSFLDMGEFSEMKRMEEKLEEAAREQP